MNCYFAYYHNQIEQHCHYRCCYILHYFLQGENTLLIEINEDMSGIFSYNEPDREMNFAMK